ncbi:hypothetical protein AY605_14465 [Acinetobacter sp. SFD]|nr:hypothetical protein AY605_14465 [Acinetobacter sp. SFD]
MFGIERSTSEKKPKWKSLEFYKDNRSILIFLPAGVGRLFQLLHLLSMVPSLLRFFSVEQVRWPYFYILMFTRLFAFLRLIK